jgi:CsoR family transcriptional regulator, copper-sensing transcriptional repressor
LGRVPSAYSRRMSAGPSTTPHVRERAEVVEERFALPAILAAVASIPAMFLTMLEGNAALVGSALNYASLAVLTAETVVLLVLAGDRLQWLRRHALIVGVAVVSVPAVIFAIGPVQVLRLVRFVGALRVIRVRRILKAGSVLRRRAGWTDWCLRVLTVVVSLASAGFVALVLADPTSQSRRVVDGTLERFGVSSVVLAAAILAGATYVVFRARGGPGDTPAPEEADGDR